MAHADDICSLTVRKDGTVELRHGNSEYISKLLYDRHTEAVVERLDRLAKMHPGACEQEDLHLLGDTLFSILFGQQASQVLRADDDQVKDHELKGHTLRDSFLRIVDAHKDKRRDRPLRLDLVFDQGADKWANLPWEFLYAFRSDNQGFFVAGEGTSLSLTRIIKPSLNRPEPSDPPLMLLVLAQPRALFYNVPKEGIKELQNHLRTLLGLPEGRLEPLIEPTWEKLADRLTDERQQVPDIIHFIGHGRFQNGESQIALHRSANDMDTERADNPQHTPTDVDWRDVRDLKAQLAGRAPWLFFLQTCNSGRPDRRPDPGFGAFRSAAQLIAQAEVPFVVAMQYEIAADDARKFADTFYTELGKEVSVDEAVMKGREVLGKLSPAYGHPRFATPVVYLRSEHRVLVRLRRPESGDGVANSVWPQFCPHCSEKLIDKRKKCRCPKRMSLVYCAEGHANVPGDTECGMHDCHAPLEEDAAMAESAVTRRRDLA